MEKTKTKEMKEFRVTKNELESLLSFGLIKRGDKTITLEDIECFIKADKLG